MAEPKIPTRPPLPPKLVEQAKEFASGARVPAEPRNAATVVLLRPGAGQCEVYLLHRQSSMAFAAGMCVFPGGGVDPRDNDDLAEHWAGPSPAEWAERLGVDEGLARALVCAAVRETFEESGVLLAGATSGDVVADTSGDDWEADREALEARELSMTDFLAKRELVLRTDLLAAWSAWLTPEFEPRRYRTWFFVAGLPEGQVTRDVSSESTQVSWTPLSQALAKVDDGEVSMMLPTYVTCAEIAPNATPADALATAQRRMIELFMPSLIEVDDGYTLTNPPWLATS